MAGVVTVGWLAGGVVSAQLELLPQSMGADSGDVSQFNRDKALPSSLRKEIVDAIHSISVQPTKGAAAK
eukprot:gene15806-20192_t